MTLLIALALHAVLPPADVDIGVVDAEAVIAAFKQVCWSGTDMERAAQGALKHGWTALEVGRRPVADSQRKAMESGAKPNYRVSVRQFQRKLQDRDLLLTIQRGELTAPAAESFGSTHCIIRELGDPLPLDVLTAQKAMGRLPNEITQSQDGSLFLSWHGLDLGPPTSVTVGYIPPKSDLVEPGTPAGIYLNTDASGPWGAKQN